MFSIEKFINIFNFSKKTKILINCPEYQMNSSERIFFEYLANGDVLYCEKMFKEGFVIAPEFRGLLEFESRIIFEKSLISIKSPHPVYNFSNLNFLNLQEKKKNNKEDMFTWNPSIQKNAGIFLRFLLGKNIYSKNMLSLIGKDISSFIPKDNKILLSEDLEKMLDISEKYNNTNIGIIDRGNNNDFLFYGNKNNIFLIGFEKPKKSKKPSIELINYTHRLKKKKRYKTEDEEPLLIQNLKNDSYFYHLNITDLKINETLDNRMMTFKDSIFQAMVSGEVSLELKRKRERDIVSMFFVKDLIHSLIEKKEVTHTQIFEENIDNRPGLRGLALFALLDNFKEVAPLVTEEKIVKLRNIPLFNSNLFDIAYKALLDNKKQNNFQHVREEIQKNKLNNNSDFSILDVIENISLPLEIKEKALFVVNKLNNENVSNLQDQDIKSMIENVKSNIEDVIMNYANLNQVFDTKKLNNNILDVLKKAELEVNKIEKIISGAAVKDLQLEQKILKKYSA